MAIVAILAIIIYGAIGGKKKGDRGSGGSSTRDGGRGSADKKKGRGNVDGLFWKRLMKLIKVVLPNWKSREA